MASYVGLVRGINVGGRNALSMDRLRGLFRDAGAHDVRTYIQSGNVLFSLPEVTESWAAALEAAISTELRTEITTVYRTHHQLEAVLTANPYLHEVAMEPTKLAVAFLDRPPAAEDLAKLANRDLSGDRFHCDKADMYLHCPNGFGKAKLTNALIERVLRRKATTRNWATVSRLWEMSQ